MRSQRLQRQKMSRGQIDYVNVIADAGAVARGIIGAENGNRFSLAQRSLQHQRNQVRFRLMCLSQIIRSARCIEISEAGIAQSVNAVHPAQHPLHQQL